MDSFQSINKKTKEQKEATSAYNRKLYANRRKEKLCRYCEKTFLGKDKEKVCDNCKKLRGEKHTESYKKIEQTLLCPVCGVNMGKRIVIANGMSTKEGKSKKLCADCLERSKSNRPKMTELTKQRIRISKLGDKNPRWNPNKKPKRERSDGLLGIKKRMTENNPMKNEATKEKVRKTKLRDPIKYKRGPAHHLWKGNRANSFVLRTRLGPWIKTVLRNDNYKCCRCEKTGALEVHHLIPLRSIVAYCLLKFSKQNLDQFDINSQEWERFVQMVLSFHFKEKGISLCKKCHTTIDYRRRGYRETKKCI